MTPMAEQTPHDPLDELRERVRAAQAAAEALAREAAAAASGADVPPGGWASSPGATSQFSEEVQSLASLLEALRDLLPPELRQQVNELVRQLLLVLRALIDWWVERMDRGPRGGEPEVEDIAIA